jgi:hypothetical protein
LAYLLRHKTLDPTVGHFTTGVHNTPMADRVFISHPEPDQSTAQAICDLLESNNVPCWIAPRDIPPGTVWRTVIYDAIHDCPLFILLHSVNTSQAQNLLNELQLASDMGKPIILFRVDNTPLSKEIQFCASRYQFFDPNTNTLEQLIQSVQRMLRDKTLASSSPIPPAVHVRPRTPPVVRIQPPPHVKKSAAPTYGGKLLLRALSIDLPTMDPTLRSPSLNYYSSESLFERDWTLDRNI